jgi:demethylmenaquinone methyltransferase/2-methoxy-6-polyprenyl-1,4-benzoquinol methylase
LNDKKTKSEKVKNVFNSIAFRYDLANHLLSFGTDYRWRRIAVKMTNPAKDDHLLDMCCGTGDLSFSFAKAQTPKITGADFSPEMIELARQKQNKRSFPQTEFNWTVADCTATGFDPESFDIISCAFGVRNLADLPKGLTEMHRLLTPAGRACILEFTLPKNPLVKFAYLLYFRYLLPLIGGLITGKLAAYKYLADSVQKWDSDIDLPTELKNAGFQQVTTKPLSFGIAAIYLAKK